MKIANASAICSGRCDQRGSARSLSRPRRIIGPQTRPSVGTAFARPRIGELVEARAPDLEMKVRPGGVTGAGGFGDLLAADYDITWLHEHGVPLEVIVARREHTRHALVADHDHVAPRETPKTAWFARAAVVADRRA